MTRVVLHIDRLALRGLDRIDRAALLAGLREELGRQFAQPQLVSAWSASSGGAGSSAASDGTLARVSAGQVAAGRGVPSHTLGVRLARAVASAGRP